jgi:hypothetical protein
VYGRRAARAFRRKMALGKHDTLRSLTTRNPSVTSGGVYAASVDILDLFRPLSLEPRLGYPVVARLFLNGNVAAAEEPRGRGRRAGSGKGVEDDVVRL